MFVFFSPESKPGIKAQPGKGCPRCGFEVYAAEQMISKNGVSYNYIIFITVHKCFSYWD